MIFIWTPETFLSSELQDQHWSVSFDVSPRLWETHLFKLDFEIHTNFLTVFFPIRSDLNLQIRFSYKNRDKYNIALAILLSLNSEYIFLLDILLYLSVSMRAVIGQFCVPYSAVRPANFLVPD